jgi:hypothetical protein
MRNFTIVSVTDGMPSILKLSTWLNTTSSNGGFIYAVVSFTHLNSAFSRLDFERLFLFQFPELENPQPRGGERMTCCARKRAPQRTQGRGVPDRSSALFFLTGDV